MPDGVVPEVVVEMAVGTQEMYGFQLVAGQIVDNCRSLGIIVGAAVDDDCFAGFVAHYIGVLLQHVADKSLDINHSGT